MSCGAVSAQVGRTDAKWQRASAKKSCSSVDASCFTPDGYLPCGGSVVCRTHAKQH